MKSKSLIFVLVLIAAFVVAISGCTSPTPTAAPTAAPTATPAATTVPAATAALMINGTVANQTTFSLADLKALPQVPINASTTNSKGVTNSVNGTGVLLNTLLDKASPAANATNITFIGADGYFKTTNLSTVRATTNATVLIKEDGSLMDVVPTLSYGHWVSNLTVITIS